MGDRTGSDLPPNDAGDQSPSEETTPGDPTTSRSPFSEFHSADTFSAADALAIDPANDADAVEVEIDEVATTPTEDSPSHWMDRFRAALSGNGTPTTPSTSPSASDTPTTPLTPFPTTSTSQHDEPLAPDDATPDVPATDEPSVPDDDVTTSARQWFTSANRAIEEEAAAITASDAAPEDTTASTADDEPTTFGFTEASTSTTKPDTEATPEPEPTPLPNEGGEAKTGVAGAAATAAAGIGDKARERLKGLRGFSAPDLGDTSRLWDRVREIGTPAKVLTATVPHTLTLGIGAVLILIALLSNSAGTALIVASAIVPILILLTLNLHDVLEHEPPLFILASLVAGAIAGLIVGWLGSWITSESWFDTGILNYGAAGFGGRFADADGAAPFLVWFLNGLVLPLVGLAGVVAAPIALRRLDAFRNELMDGVILTGAGGAGFAIATAIVFWVPLYGDGGPSTSVSDWTLTIIGMGILRPIILALTAAMLGAGIWRYLVTPRPFVLILPGIGSIGGLILATLGSIWIQPSGLWPEVLWLAIVALAIYVLYRRVIKQAIAYDQRVLGTDGTRVVCPHCHRLTVRSAFCSRCGEPLPEDLASA